MDPTRRPPKEQFGNSRMQARRAIGISLTTFFFSDLPLADGPPPAAAYYCTIPRSDFVNALVGRTIHASEASEAELLVLPMALPGPGLPPSTRCQSLAVADRAGCAMEVLLEALPLEKTKMSVAS